MAKKKAAAAAPFVAHIDLTATLERNADGYGALPGVQLDAEFFGITREQRDTLEKQLAAQGYECASLTLRQQAADDEAASEAMADLIDCDMVSAWAPIEPSGPGWILVGVLYWLHTDLIVRENVDAIAFWARPAGMVDGGGAEPSQPETGSAWPFPKTEGGGPDAVSEPASEPVTMSKADAHLKRASGLFELAAPVDVLLKTWTPRTEKHGDDEVSATSLGIKISGANTLLDLLSPTLRTMLYAAPEGQAQLPGVEVSTPLLRCKLAEKLHLTSAFEGWTLRIYHGIHNDPFVISGCKVDKFVVTPFDGGSCEIDFRIGSSDIDEEEAGWLYGKQKQEISISLHAPVKTAAIDGSVEAFKRDHPEAEKTATDLFTAQHGGASDEDDGPIHGDNPGADAVGAGETTQGTDETEGAEA